MWVRGPCEYGCPWFCGGNELRLSLRNNSNSAGEIRNFLSRVAKIGMFKSRVRVP